MSNDTKHVCKTNLKSIYHRRTLTGHSVGVKKVAISPDGSHAVSTDAEHKMKFWDLRTGDCIRTIEGSFACTSADGRFVLSSSRYETESKRTLGLSDIATGERIRTFEKMSSGYIECLSPDCKYAVCSDDNKLQLWELSLGKCIRNFEVHSHSSRVSFSNDGQWLYCGGIDSDLIEIWHISKNKCLRTFKTPNAVSTIFPHPNGEQLFTAGSGGDVYLWDIATGKLLSTFKGQRTYVASICLSLDCKYLFSGGGDNTISVWDVDNRNYIILRGHTERISSISLSRDAKWLVSSSDHYEDKTIRLWELDWELEEVEKKDWSEGAQPYLESFLTLHCEYGEDGLIRVGKPIWNDEDFKELLGDLQYRGYGWLRPEGIRKKLEEMTANWQGPPPLLGE